MTGDTLAERLGLSVHRHRRTGRWMVSSAELARATAHRPPNINRAAEQATRETGLADALVWEEHGPANRRVRTCWIPREVLGKMRLHNVPPRCVIVPQVIAEYLRLLDMHERAQPSYPMIEEWRKNIDERRRARELPATPDSRRPPLAHTHTDTKRERVREYMTSTLTAKVALVTPQDARHLRNTCHFERQRAINELNTQRLAVEMSNDRFIPGTTVYFAVLPDGSMLILNGNHTLEAVCTSGRPQWLVFIFNPVADVAEAARLYGSFDIHKARTWTDALKALGADRKFVMSQAVMPAVGHIQQNFNYNPRNVEANSSRSPRFAKMDDYEEAAVILQAALAGAPRAHKSAIKRKGVMAVALETVRYQPGHGALFWKDVAHDDGLAVGDPRKTLLRWLLTNKIAVDKSPGPTAANISSRAAIAAWNAWYRGDALQHIRPLAGQIMIAGTPWGSERKASWPADAPADPAPDAPQSKLTDLFETGVRVTETGNTPVILYKKRAEG